MSLRGVVRDGGIELIDPLPADWKDGHEVIVGSDEEGPPLTPDEVDRCMDEADRLAAELDPEDLQRMFDAIAEHRAEAKERTRREWGLP